MEKLLRKTGINQSLRLLLIVASLVFGSSAWGQINLTETIELTTFTSFSGSNQGYQTVSNYTVKDSKGNSYSGFAVANCMLSGTSLQMRASDGKITSPTITSEAGFDITVTYTSKANFTISFGNDATNSTAKSPLSTSTTSTSTTFSVSVGSKYGKISKITLTPKTTSGGGKTAATVTFAQESYSVQTNGEITVSATKNSTSSPIVYSISPEDDNVLINKNTGYIVTGNKAGTYTITATVAENETYTSASATCVLTVTAPAPPSYKVAAPTYYKKITSTDELAVGGTYLIVCEGAKKALSATVSTVGYTQGENNTVTNETAAALGEFELIDTSEDYNGAPLYEFLVDNKYLSGTTSKTISLATSVSDNTKWIVDFDANGNVEIDSYSTVTASTPRGLLFQTGQTIKHYAISNRGTSNYPALQLYQKVTDLAISTLTNGYATFVTDVPYVMPKGTCGYAVIVAPHVGVITKTEAYTEGSQVPAQTALLIGGALGTNYYPAVLKENVVASYNGENYMEGARTAGGLTSSLRGVDVYYYKLALNREGNPGFYYGATDGAAFKLTKPTTAYLAVPKSGSPVNGYLIDFEGETTGIDSIGQTDGNANGAIYNLNGIRMAQPLRSLPKGVYVVNGKKVIK